MFQRVSRIVGLDLSDTSAEAVFVDLSAREPKWLSRARIVLPEGLIEEGVIRDTKAMGQIIRKMLDSATPKPISHKNVIINISDRHVVSRIIPIPQGTLPSRFPELVRNDVIGYVPYPIGDVEIDYAVMESPGGGKSIFYAAIPKTTLENLRATTTAAGVNLLDVDLELLALARLAAMGKHGEGAHLIVDIGGEVSTIAIFDLKLGLQRSAIVPFGGAHLTRALAKKGKLPMRKAETLKRAAGFSPKVNVGRVFFILQNEIQKLMTEIKRTIEEFEEHTEQKVVDATLAGGTSLVPELPEYIGQTLGLPVQIADPIAIGAVTSSIRIPREQSILFANALGAVLAARPSKMPQLSFFGKTRKISTIPASLEVEETSVTTPISQSLASEQKRLTKKKQPAKNRFAFFRKLTSNKKKFVLILIIVGTLFVGIAAAGTWYFVFREKAIAPAVLPSVDLSEDLRITYPLKVTLIEENVSNEVILGKKLTASKSGEKAVPVSSTESVPDYADGEVTLINETEDAQTLVDSTRLLSSNGVLFRMQEDALIPANGQVTARIAADQSGELGNVPAGRFTIPGLSTSAQQVIYGQTSESTTGGVRETGTITDADVQKTVSLLKEELTAQVLAKWKEALVPGERLFPEPVVLSVRSSELPEAGEASSDMAVVKMTISFIGMTISEEVIARRADAAVATSVGNESASGVYAFSDWQYILDSYDETAEKADLTIRAQATLKK